MVAIPVHPDISLIKWPYHELQSLFVRFLDVGVCFQNHTDAPTIFYWYVIAHERVPRMEPDLLFRRGALGQ